MIRAQFELCRMSSAPPAVTTLPLVSSVSTYCRSVWAEPVSVQKQNLFTYLLSRWSRLCVGSLLQITGAPPESLPACNKNKLVEPE